MIVSIDGDTLTLEEFENVVLRKHKIELAYSSKEKIKKSYDYVQKIITAEKTVYGINTGFGKFSDTIINKQNLEELQLNLIKSHACGVGDPLPTEIVRGMMLLRVNALAKGYSGISLETIDLLLELINNELHPVVPSQGSLGASGDLAPLSHMVLPLVGLGKIEYKEKIYESFRALDLCGLKPIKLQPKEGLALINGTQMMCSFSAMNIISARNILYCSDIIAATSLEALTGLSSAFKNCVHSVRGHMGQITTAQNILNLVTNSALIDNKLSQKVQDAYSLRCIPQVHGASKDTYNFSYNTVLTEMNAATDNPLIFPDTDEIISGGNFHGQPLALMNDYLTIAMSEIANISERRTERLVNPHLNGDLPGFLTENGGLNSGYMILQYVAASLVSENKTLCYPASVDSIPSSANQEDHVSMGSISARKCYQVLKNIEKVLAIEYLCSCQALEFSTENKGAGTQIAYDLLRRKVPKLENDRENSEDIEIATKIISEGTLVSKILHEINMSL